MMAPSLGSVSTVEEKSSTEAENNVMNPNPDPARKQEDTDSYSTNYVCGSGKLAEALDDFFADYQETKGAATSPCVDSFSVVLSKKRTISVEVGGEFFAL